MAISTARRFKTGKVPGSPRHTGHTLLFGASPNRFAHPQKILLFVSSCTWTSSPMTGSYLTSTSGAIATVSDADLAISKPRLYHPTPARLAPTHCAFIIVKSAFRYSLDTSTEVIWPA